MIKEEGIPGGPVRKGLSREVVFRLRHEGEEEPAPGSGAGRTFSAEGAAKRRWNVS